MIKSLKYFGFLLITILCSCTSVIKYSSDVNLNDSGIGGGIIPKEKVFFGKASFYADKFEGRLTANGERFNQAKLTCAHKTLPFNTVLKVTNLSNNKSVIVKVNDRGPFIEARVIDLSKSAAEKIDMINDGVVEVKCEIISE